MTAETLFRPLFREGSSLRLLDQRLLPAEEVWLVLDEPGGVAQAIRDMAVRGAPAIGVAAAYGAAFSLSDGGPGTAREKFEAARALLAASRPTAVNLFAALERMAVRFDAVADWDDAALERALVEEADAVAAEDIASCRRIGAVRAALLRDGHDRAHALQRRGARDRGLRDRARRDPRRVAAGKAIRVLADETRPFLQGARLTAWELARDGIPVEILTDSMAGHFLSRGEIAAVIVGADRIAANGDTANKIGTYSARGAREGKRHPVLRRRAGDDDRSRRARTVPPSRSRSGHRPRC